MQKNKIFFFRFSLFITEESDYPYEQDEGTNVDNNDVLEEETDNRLAPVQHAPTYEELYGTKAVSTTQNVTTTGLTKPKWHAPWKLYRVISGHLGWVRCVAVEPGNEWFATGAADRIIKVSLLTVLDSYICAYHKTNIKRIAHLVLIHVCFLKFMNSN